MRVKLYILDCCFCVCVRAPKKKVAAARIYTNEKTREKERKTKERERRRTSESMQAVSVPCRCWCTSTRQSRRIYFYTQFKVRNKNVKNKKCLREDHINKSVILTVDVSFASLLQYLMVFTHSA